MDDITVNLKLPSREISGTWKPDESEHNAAWEMYVELVTRIHLIAARPDEGLLQEALASLDGLSERTREILRAYGPIVAQPSGGGDLSFGSIAVAVLNLAARPVIAKWRPLLQDWAEQKPAGVPDWAHEQNWDRAAELRQALDDVRAVLRQFAALLEQAAEVPSLIIEQPA
jgi:hypothetical protein